MAASNTFYLKIISANRVFYSGRCRSLIVPEYDGQKEILAHHEDMVIAIDDGEMRFQPEGVRTGNMQLSAWALLRSSTTV